MTINATSDYREYNQVVADLQHGFLEMAGGFRALHHLRSLAEVGVGTGGVHHRFDFALANDGAGEYRVARLFFGG